MNRLALFFLLLAALPRDILAQSASPVGVRAAGMGGAFTAVADDGTAPYWNPAGLASGALAGVTLDTNTLDRHSSVFFGFATPPLGISYFREKVAGTFPGKVPATSTAGDASGRNGDGESLVVHHIGGTVVQSIGDSRVAVGATLGAVHGNQATAFNADAGVMLAGAIGSLGLVVHNVTEPSLGDVRLERRVRGGVAVHVRQDLTVAADSDFTTVSSPVGDWRDAAIGMEAHPHPRAWLRSGLHWNTAGSGDAGAAPIGSIGGSFAVYGSLRVDAQGSFGSKDGDRGWGVGLSFLY